jgi:glycosyltransferase involved in cell wall biosynthesis
MLGWAAASGVEPLWLSHSKRVGPVALASLWRQLHRNRPGLLYTLTVIPNIWGRVLGALEGVPAVVSGWRNFHPKQHEWLLWRLSRRIICNAEVLKGVMVSRCGVDPKRIAVIRNGVDVEYFAPRPEGRAPVPTVLYAGRLVAEKNPVGLLECFRIAAQRLPDARFLMIGNGKLRETAVAFIGRHDLRHRVELLSGQSEIRQYLHKAWIFAMASRREGSPNIILEAMASGLPVVATRAGGVVELVDDGVNGILCDHDNPVQFAEALVRLLGDSRLRESMGIRAREKVLRSHTIRAMVRSTEQTLLEAWREGEHTRVR